MKTPFLVINFMIFFLCVGYLHAQTDFNTYLDVSKNYEIGREEFGKRNFKKTIIALEKVTKKLKNIPDTNYIHLRYREAFPTLGLCYERTGDFRKALDCYAIYYQYQQTKYNKYMVLANYVRVHYSKEGWKPIINKRNETVESNTSIYFFNSSTIKRKNGKIQVWEKVIEFQSPTTSEEMDEWSNEVVDDELHELLHQEFPYSLQLSEYDCNLQRARLLQYMDYDEKGNLIKSRTVEEPRWDSVAPGTIGASILESYCK